MILVRDLSAHGKLRLTGKDRVRFLNGLCTNDVARLGPGEGCHAAILTVKGRVLADFLVYVLDGALDLDLDPALTEKLKAALDRHLIADDVAVEDRSAALSEQGVYGAAAAEVIAGALAGHPDLGVLPLHHHREVEGVRIARAHDLALPGFRLSGEPAALAAVVGRLGGAPLDDEAWEVLRVEAGVPRYGAEVSEEHLPMESRLEDTISYSKGCFLGQEVVVRLRDQGHLNWRLMGLFLDGTEVAAKGDRLAAPGRDPAGAVTSSVVSPRFGAIALAYVHRSAWAPGTELTLHAGVGARRAIVTELPFGEGDAR